MDYTEAEAEAEAEAPEAADAPAAVDSVEEVGIVSDDCDDARNYHNCKNVWRCPG